MATPSSILAWRIPGTREPVALPSMGSHTTEATYQQQQQHLVKDIVLLNVYKKISKHYQ